MDLISRLYDFQPHTPVKSSEVDAELSQLVNAVNAIIGLLNSVSVPIGTILPFDDFDGALQFDTEYFCYCDGEIHTVGEAQRTVPDLSGRYLVGFGGEGDGDIATADWDADPVGAEAHQIDLGHSHTCNNHYHSLSGHTHSVVSGHTGLGELDLSAGLMDYCTPGENFFLKHKHGPGTLATGGPSNDTTGWSTDRGTDSQLSATQSIQPRSIRVRFIMRKK